MYFKLFNNIRIVLDFILNCSHNVACIEMFKNNTVSLS